MTQAIEIPQVTNQSAPATTCVAVCIATYRRPDGLRRLLHALEQLEFRVSALPSVYVVVVDNDPSVGAGFQVCNEIHDFRWKLQALREQRKGISFARNTAMHRALELGADAIVFIDDDEVPEPEWLEGYCRCIALRERKLSPGLSSPGLRSRFPLG